MDCFFLQIDIYKKSANINFFFYKILKSREHINKYNNKKSALSTADTYIAKAAMQ